MGSEAETSELAHDVRQRDSGALRSRVGLNSRTGDTESGHGHIAWAESM
jgi:hypothetical protein